MPFLSEADQDQLRAIFTEQLDCPVRLRLLTQPPAKLFIPGQQLCASCAEAEPFVRELATLSDKLEVVVHNVREEPEVAQQYGVQGLLPAILLECVAQDGAGDTDAPMQGAVRFLGLPARYEFSTLVTDLVDLSTGHVDLSAPGQAELRELAQDVHLQVFVTPT
jgi:thiol-disulfide isomerase/thioredoxin